MKYKVLVMLSAYNGERFVKQQIESILKQEHVDIDLVIRDDGSRDNTANVLKEFENIPNIKVIYGGNSGFAASFWELLLGAGEGYDYYAFSDQDDVWEPEKLAAAVAALEKHKDEYKLYASALKVTDENLNYQYTNDFPKLKSTLGSALTRPRISGCTMVFNAKLLDMCKRLDLKNSNVTLSHDVAVYLTCLMLGGKVVFSKHSYINLRRHSDTVTGHGKGIMKRVASVLDIFTARKNEASKQLELLFNTYKEDMNEESLKLCNDILAYKKSFGKTLKLSVDKRIKCNLKSVDITNFFAILFRCY